MTQLSFPEGSFLGTVLEGIIYGVYCVIFSLYLNLYGKNGGNRLIYPLSAMFILCTCFVCIDFTDTFLTILRPTPKNLIVASDLNVATSTIYSLVDAISQGVLIYRCWIMWEKRPLFIVLPSLLTLASFATYLAIDVTVQIQDTPAWFFPLGVASFSISLCVNAIVTGLLIYKLVQIHGEIPAGKGKYSLRSLIAVLIESGMLTFVSQLTWVVLFKIQSSGLEAWGSPLTMIYGLTPTIVLVRVAMKKSFETRTTVITADTSMNFAMRPIYTNPMTSITVTSVVQKDQDMDRFARSTDDLEK